MKKLFLLSLAATMILSLAACGDSTSSTEASTAASVAEATAAEATAAGSDVSLVDISTDFGLTMKLPSDMTLQNVNGNSMYISSDKSSMVGFTVTDNDGTPVSEEKEETYLTGLQSKYKDVVMKKFDNTIKIDGKDAFLYEASFTTPAGSPIVQTAAAIVDGARVYIITFTCGDNSSSLVQNIQACIDSIKLTPVQ